MGLKISDLLRWRGSIELKNADGSAIKDDHDKPVSVYLRIVSDPDLDLIYKNARVMSGDMRKKLRDTESTEYKDQVLPIKEATQEEAIELIKTARQQNYGTQAYANMIKPDLIKIEEIAVDPDAATLEEQEQLDAANKKQDEEFQEALEAYVNTKMEEDQEELSKLSIEELRAIAELEVSNITSLGYFLQIVQDLKMVYGCYNDKTYRERSFDDLEDYRVTSDVIKTQLLQKYRELEFGNDEIKN